ncbi:MAG: hypothetical protein Tp152SUR00d2C52646391_41 [Prokaryotic dsDNA virus sp.]|nr:MAG: hypothetical protein Tp152SUR00d2C52646391_41 [Prokaryotic dsDNA virus sp.]|tara:strand:+ start:42 stop:347 length:306 start_codon:yes stop_codon:yes gene_type:complete
MYDISVLPPHMQEKIKVCPETSCWLFEGKDPTPNGYQRTWYKGVRNMAHRAIYTILVGGNIENRELDHSCCNRACVNPNHLNPVTHKKNCILRDKRNRNAK